MAEEVVNGKKVILTADGLKKLEDELSELKNVRRAEIAQELKEARAQGDLSENAEYDAAKDAQRIIEERIVEIETLLKNVEVVDSSEIDSERVSIGCRVKLRDMEFKEDMEFLMVGSTEASSLQGKMSNESPVGKAILGHKKGETVKVETKAGKIKYKILEVSVDNK